MGNQIVCNDCTDDLIDEAIDADFTEYAKSREYEEGLLTYVSRELYHWFEIHDLRILVTFFMSSCFYLIRWVKVRRILSIGE
ncbi:Hypothetical predicted protein [Cloeon dipterum]|uniref:Uncharacterized protein n=1 Tax=Cloeon dipterum TaxID=197152 RepID=A0A8S1E7N0_9INSE|nr:Hypothetical predicted protein [Cloeon dipterum]